MISRRNYLDGRGDSCPRLESTPGYDDQMSITLLARETLREGTLFPPFWFVFDY